ncbi:MAG: phosphatidate cytidylyltransferase [Anaerolineales bacterium]|nr:phosphatidate cytidylyltransferase [Anaerolineales bacterium]
MNNLAQRLLFTVVALPTGIFLIFWGAWPYAIFIALILARAAWEYADLFHLAQGKSLRWLMVAGVTGILLVRFLLGTGHDHWILALVCAAAALYQLVQYERGYAKAGSAFAAMLSGIIYIGLMGSYMLILREVPEHGEWWLMLTVFAVILADTSAYFFGIRFGRRRMVPRLSPKKSWEGYAGGLVGAALGTPAFGLLFHVFGMPKDAAFSVANMALLGLCIGLLSPLGDLTISMIKREMKLKDTSDILPGHGGVLDRADSWLWAFPIGYYLALYLS